MKSGILARLNQLIDVREREAPWRRCLDGNGSPSASAVATASPVAKSASALASASAPAPTSATATAPAPAPAQAPANEQEWQPVVNTRIRWQFEHPQDVVAAVSPKALSTIAESHRRDSDSDHASPTHAKQRSRVSKRSPTNRRKPKPNPSMKRRGLPMGVSPMRGAARAAPSPKREAAASVGAKFKPNLEVLKHNMSHSTVATLRGNFQHRTSIVSCSDGATTGDSQHTGGATAAAAAAAASASGASKQHKRRRRGPRQLQRSSSPITTAGSSPSASPNPKRVAANAFAAAALGGGGNANSPLARRGVVMDSQSFLAHPLVLPSVAGVNSSTSFGVVQPQRLAALLARFLAGFGDLNAQYSSVSVFLQVKMAEVESMTGQTQQPNLCRTAVSVQ